MKKLTYLLVAVGIGALLYFKVYLPGEDDAATTNPVEKAIDPADVTSAKQAASDVEDTEHPAADTVVAKEATKETAK